MDDLIQDAINDEAGRSKLLDVAMKLCANELIFLVVPLLLLLWFWPLAESKQAYNQRIVGVMVLSVGVALLAGMLLAHLHYQPRPFVADHTTRQLIAHAVDNGFPSDHTTFAFAVAGALVWFKRGLGLLALGAAALVGLSRIYVGVHWPSDVVAGATIGLVAGTLLARTEPLLLSVQTVLARIVPRILLASP